MGRVSAGRTATDGGRVKRRWRLLASLGAVAAALVLVPIGGIELGCPALPGATPSTPPDQTPPAARRPQARTWLTYPEWHIVYSAESLGRYLVKGGRPSGYDYGADVAGFWRSYCAINRIAGARAGAAEAKQMIYVIGISFTVEMAVKAGWESTIGRVSEWLGGWHSPEDRYAAGVQQRYGAFMHEVPWYDFDFAGTLARLWRTHDGWSIVRRPERRLALSAEYGVKAVYAKGIGALAAMQPDATTLVMTVRASPQVVAAIDPRLRPLATGTGRTRVSAPRYAQFTDLLGKLADHRIAVESIAGNRTIFVTLLAPTASVPRAALLAMPLGDRPGWSRYGVTVPVAELTARIAAARASGIEIEHVYDY
ncbi:MAG TPA: hypothetical protein VNJ10_09840 [Sphingomonas sp.]|nr:hypothetical protein [Sphingomonas sp.]